MCLESLSDIQQIHDLSEEGPAFARTDRRLIEDPSVLDYGCFVMVVLVDAALIVLFK